MNFSPELIWFLVGLALILSEFMVPGVILVFFGMGAWITAITSWLGVTPGWSSQFIAFSISSVVMLVLLRRWFRGKLTGYVGDDQDPDANLDEFKGQIVVVIEEIDASNLEGTVEFKGAHWKARAARPIAAGEKAVVESADGITLVVAPINSNEEE